MRKIPLVNRFWENVRKTESCWIWTACKRGGYGLIYGNGRRQSAHRLSYEIHKGPIPDGLDCLHKCDNPSCVNPEHLFIGTHRDNMVDAAKKKRFKTGKDSWASKNKHKIKRRTGSNHHMSKLTESQVSEIRLLWDRGGITKTELGKRYGVSQVQAGKIVREVNWKTKPTKKG